MRDYELNKEWLYLVNWGIKICLDGQCHQKLPVDDFEWRKDTLKL